MLHHGALGNDELSTTTNEIWRSFIDAPIRAEVRPEVVRFVRSSLPR